MKNFLISLLLFAALPLCAQNLQRYSIDFSSITSQYTTPFVVANVPPNSPLLSVCNSPANQVPCTNYATTYNSAGTPCANGTQDTPDPQPSNCQSTGDAQGNIGFWAYPGTYDYTVCIQNTVTCFGPYTVTLGLASQFCTITSLTGPIALNGSTPVPICTFMTSASGTPIYQFRCDGVYTLTSGTNPTLILSVGSSQLRSTSGTASFGIGSTLTGTSTQVTGNFTTLVASLTGATNTTTNAPFHIFGFFTAAPMTGVPGAITIYAAEGGTSSPAGAVNPGTICSGFRSS
jgi:hypothetical protein